MRINCLFSILVTLLFLQLSYGCMKHPIVVEKPRIQSVVLSTPSNFTETTSKEWEKLGQNIVNTDKKVIYLEIRGDGGFTSYLLDFLHQVDLAHRKGKVIIGVIVGPAISCHALLACYMDSIIFSNNRSYLYFHAPAMYTMEGKFVGYSSDKVDLEQQNAYFSQCTKSGILTFEQQFDVEIAHKVIIVRKGYSYLQDQDPR